MQTTALIRLRSSSGETGTKLVERLLRKASRTAKPCGPGTRCWCQVGGGLAGLDRASRDRQFADDGDKKELVAEESAV
jgi:hypothetical protein